MDKLPINLRYVHENSSGNMTNAIKDQLQENNGVNNTGSREITSSHYSHQHPSSYMAAHGLMAAAAAMYQHQMPSYSAMMAGGDHHYASSHLYHQSQGNSSHPWGMHGITPQTTMVHNSSHCEVSNTSENSSNNYRNPSNFSMSSLKKEFENSTEDFSPNSQNSTISEVGFKMSKKEIDIECQSVENFSNPTFHSDSVLSTYNKTFKKETKHISDELIPDSYASDLKNDSRKKFQENVDCSSSLMLSESSIVKESVEKVLEKDDEKLNDKCSSSLENDSSFLSNKKLFSPQEYCYICAENVNMNSDSWRHIYNDFTTTSFVQVSELIFQIMKDTCVDLTKLKKITLVCSSCFTLLDKVDELRELLKVSFIYFLKTSPRFML